MGRINYLFKMNFSACRLLLQSNKSCVLERCFLRKSPFHNTRSSCQELALAAPLWFSSQALSDRKELRFKWRGSDNLLVQSLTTSPQAAFRLWPKLTTLLSLQHAQVTWMSPVPCRASASISWNTSTGLVITRLSDVWKPHMRKLQLELIQDQTHCTLKGQWKLVRSHLYCLFFLNYNEH